MASAVETLKEQVGIQKKPITILELLESLKPQIALALPKHLTPERMVRIAITCLRTNPKLAECEPQTILASVMLASQLGLEPGVLGQCFLVPYKKTCTLVPGWLGILDLVSRAGKATAWTGAVYNGDEFSWALGDRPYVTHRPCGDETQLTHVYAVARTRGSDYPIIEVWPMEKIVKHRSRFNKVGDQHYSYNHFEMYARKVVLLQALKYVPRSIELSTAFNLDAQAEMGTQHLEIKDVPDFIEGKVVAEETPEFSTDKPTEQAKPKVPELCDDCRQNIVDGKGHHKLCKYSTEPQGAAQPAPVEPAAAQATVEPPKAENEKMVLKVKTIAERSKDTKDKAGNVTGKQLYIVLSVIDKNSNEFDLYVWNKNLHERAVTLGSKTALLEISQKKGANNRMYCSLEAILEVAGEQPVAVADDDF
jgi:recombination protein RecT